MRFLLVFILFFGAFFRLWANCTAPSLLSSSAVTDSTATLTWTDVADSYEIELRLLSEPLSGTPTHVAMADPPFFVNNLIPGEQYRFRVRAVCPGGGVSPWSTTRNFFTDLNNARPCPLDFTLRDTTCSSGGQVFNIHVDNVPGTSLGANVNLKGVRLVIAHPWRSDLRIWLTDPAGTRVQLVGGLNAGDQNLGNPTGNGGCGQFLELSDNLGALALSSAAEMDNITGLWLPLSPLASFHNAQNPNGIWQLEICDNKPNHTGKLRLAQLVFEPVACAAPGGLSAQNISLNSVQISWNAVNITGDSVQLLYGPAGFLPGFGEEETIQLPAGTQPPFTLLGLTGLQQYDVYLRQRCGGFWGAYGDPITFFTVCPATLTENFESIAICPTACTDPCPLPDLWQNAPGDDYEWKVRTGPGITFPTAGPPSGSGGNGQYLFFRNACTPGGANGKKAILRTLCVDMVAPLGTSCHFSLDIYMNTKLGLMGSLVLELSNNGGASWQTIKSWNGNQGKAWKREFIDLSSFNGQTVRLQLIANGATGAYGDIAIDNLNFYGALPAGSPDYFFYRDADNDSFGDTTQQIISCSPQLPQGYVAMAGDCNDAFATIFPGAAEIKCNGIDENCNGSFDDSFIPAPIIAPHHVVCAGQDKLLVLQSPAPLGSYYWFNAPVGGQIIGMGAQLLVENMQMDQTLWVADSLAAGGCSSARSPVTITVLPTPALVLGGAPAICHGDTLHLNSIAINDLSNTPGVLTFHSSAPPGTENLINTAGVQPTESTFLMALKLATNGCTDTLTIPITVFPNPSVTITNGPEISICKGKTAVLNAVSDFGTSFSWSNGLNFNTITVVATGTGVYTVTVSDTNGCSNTSQIAVETLPGITQTNVNGIQHALSCGGNEGSISLQPLDGLPPYTFMWTGPAMAGGVQSGIGAAGGVINGLTQGGYRITVTDAAGSGCSMVLPSIVINAPGLTVDPPVISQPVCPEDSGTISVNAIGVQPSFLWSNNETTATVNNLSSGLYTVTITDGSCQQILSNLEILAPPFLQILENAKQDINCYGQQNGAVDIAILGGTPGYTFQWSDLSAAEDRTGLPVGVYTVTVTDANSCSVVSNPIIITQPVPLEIEAEVLAVRCNQGGDGRISASIGGGTAPYFVEWSTGQFDLLLEDLPAGNYTISVADSNGCLASDTIVVTEPSAISIVQSNIVHPICVGRQDGSIIPIISGGLGDYSFLWSNGQTTANAVALDAGNYSFALTDENNCVFSSPVFTINAPQLLSATMDTIAHIKCFGGNNGAFNLEIEGDVGGYTAWINQVPGLLHQSFLTAGTYEIMVEDSRGCQMDTTIEILQPASPFSAVVAATSNANCFEEPTGFIDVVTSGGTPPYQFIWNNGTTTEDLDGVVAGQYYMTALDANLCVAGIANVVISEPSPIFVLPEVVSIPCYGDPFGQIFLNSSGGHPPYTFQWSHGATTANVYDLAAGDYTVSIFDAAGCLTIYDRLSVLDKSDDFELVWSAYQPVSCNSGDDGHLQITAINGKAPFQYAWSAPIGLHANSNLAFDNAENLSGGLYSVTVTDADGCFLAAGPFLVEEAPPIAIQIDSIGAIICKGASTGIIEAIANGGVPPLIFNWSNNATTPAIDSVLAGNYTLTVTDFRGCTMVTGQIQVPEPENALAINASSIVEDICSTGNGQIDLTVGGGFPNYQYVWNTGAHTPDLGNLSAGIYQVTITDEAGCTLQEAFTLIAQPPALSLASYGLNPVDCFGGSTGAIETGIGGGHLPLSYYWSNGETTANIGGLSAGFYAVTVIDNKGCAAIFPLPEITEPEAPLSATYAGAILPDGFSIALICSGGTPGYSAVWDNAAGNQTGLVAIGLLKGTYTVTITDAAGCTLVKEVSVGLSTTHPNSEMGHAYIAPNPFSDAVCLFLEQNQPVSARLMDISGNLLAIKHQEIGPKICLETEHLPAGVYFLEISDERGYRKIWKCLK